MADTLFSQISKNLSGAAKPTDLATPLQATQDASAINRATAGKAGAGGQPTGPGRSNQAVQGLVDQVQQGSQAIQRDAQIQQLTQAQQAQAQQHEAAFQQKQLSEQELDQREKFLQVQQKIIGDYVQGARTLDLQKDKSRLEQMGFGMRLGNDKYISQLNNEAQRARLSDALRFDEELKRTVFADEEELLRNDLQFRALMNAKGRELTDQLMNIDLESALAMANAENRAANQRSMWEGIGTAASAGASVYGRSSVGGLSTTPEAGHTAEATTGRVAGPV